MIMSLIMFHVQIKECFTVSQRSPVKEANPIIKKTVKL